MQLGIINSVFFGTKVDAYSDGLEEIKKMGFDTVDIYPEDGEMSSAQLKSVRKITDDIGLPIRSVPAIIFGFFSPNKAVREFTKEYGKRFVDLAAHLGADNVLLVNGEYFWQLETGFNKDWIQGMSAEGTRVMGEYAEALGIKIAIELEPFKMSIVNTIDSMEEFLNKVDLPNTVMANIDCSHLHLAGIDPSEIQRLKGRIVHCHISDAIDTHGDLPPGRGKAPMQAYINELAKAGFEGTVACELEWPPDPSREGVLAWAKEAGDATAALMKNAGVRG